MSRPINVLIAVLTIIIAAVVTGRFQFGERLIFACITAGLITCGANIINDIFDVEIDLVNKPKRLLPSKKVSAKQAWIYFYVSYFCAFVFAAMSSLPMFIIAVSIGLLLYSYSVYFKRTILWGNIVVSFSSAVAFIYGAMAVGEWKAGIIPAVFALFFHFGREVVKDMQDIEGDLAANVVTFPGKYGKTRSIILINSVFFILIVLTLMPYIFHVYNNQYLWVVVIGVDVVLIFVAIMLWFRFDQSTLGKISHILKLDMLVGLLAIYLGVNDVIFFN